MTGHIIPTILYADAPGMLDWLCRAFGFERQLVVDSEDGGVVHAQLIFGKHGMIMLGQAPEESEGGMQSTPEAVGKPTQSPYIVVDEVDALCERARAEGAEIVMEPEDQSYGGRLFCCYDPEGHLWNFGTYNPWVAPS